MTTEQWKSIGRAWLMPVVLLAMLGLLLGWWFQEAGLLDWVDGLGRVQIGILASLVAGLFTLVGALPVLLVERVSYRVQDSLLGFGAVVVTVAAFLLPLGLAFAAGAMLFVISHEIIPESHRKGHQTYATMGVLVGFVLMMTLGKILG